MPGIKYSNKDFVYVSIKKHYCPECKARIKTVKVSKTVNYRSPEAKEYDFSSSMAGVHIIPTGNYKFVWKEFECPECKKHYTVNEIRQSEGLEPNEYEHPHQKLNKKHDILGLVLFIISAIIILLIMFLLKKF